MSAAFAFSQVYGASPGTRQDLGSFGVLADLGGNDALGIDKDAMPRGGVSCELWFQLHFTGVFSSVASIVLFLAKPLPDGLTLLFNGQQLTYQTPVTTVSSIALSALPTDYEGSANVSIGGDLAGALTAPGYSDFCVLQATLASDFVRGGIDPISLGVWYRES